MGSIHERDRLSRMLTKLLTRSLTGVNNNISIFQCTLWLHNSWSLCYQEIFRSIWGAHQTSFPEIANSHMVCILRWVYNIIRKGSFRVWSQPTRETLHCNVGIHWLIPYPQWSLFGSELDLRLCETALHWCYIIVVFKTNSKCRG